MLEWRLLAVVGFCGLLTVTQGVGVGECSLNNQCRECGCVEECLEKAEATCRKDHCEDFAGNPLSSCANETADIDACLQAYRNSKEEICTCLATDTPPACCLPPSSSNEQSQIDCAIIPGMLNGKDLASPGVGCDTGCRGDNCPPCAVEASPIAGRRKRNVVFFQQFSQRFIFTQDPGQKKIPKAKSRKCCLTTRRTVPFVWRIKKNIWPVFCPLSGGYQWIDQVICNIKTKADMKKYQVRNPSKGAKCKFQCIKECTMRTYVVTNLRPQGFWGHCFYYFVPIWFRNVNVDTHCICPDQRRQTSSC